VIQNRRGGKGGSVRRRAREAADGEGLGVVRRRGVGLDPEAGGRGKLEVIGMSIDRKRFILYIIQMEQ